MSKDKYSQVFIDDGLQARAKSRYAKRRAQLMQSCAFPVVVCGVELGPGGPNTGSAVSSYLYQDPLMLYLTGLNQLGTALMMVPERSGHSETLFLKPIDSKQQFWEGAHFGIGAAKEAALLKKHTGFSEAQLLSELLQTIETLLKRRRYTKLGLFWNEGKHKATKDSNWHFYQRLKRRLRKKFPTLSFINIADRIWPARLKMDLPAQKNIMVAQDIAKVAFSATLKMIQGAKSETEIAGVLDGSIAQKTPFRNSFPSIVAGGENATVLHYTKNDAPVKTGDLLLLDFGARWQSMCSDISRTIPVSGKFNPLQRLLYQIVLEVQGEIEAMVRPGITIDALNRHCWEAMEKRLDARFFEKGGKAKREYDKQPHFVSHLMGIQVHDGDPHRGYRFTPLEAGNYLSNEPGLYGEFELVMGGKWYREKLGIRIEDDLLVTKTGCQNMSRGIPKTVAQLEKGA